MRCMAKQTAARVVDVVGGGNTSGCLLTCCCFAAGAASSSLCARRARRVAAISGNDNCAPRGIQEATSAKVADCNSFGVAESLFCCS